MGWGSWLGCEGPGSPCRVRTRACVCPCVWAQGAELPPDSQEGVPHPRIKKPCSRVCSYSLSRALFSEAAFYQSSLGPGQGQRRVRGGVQGGAGQLAHRTRSGVAGASGTHHCPLLPCIHSASQYFFELSQCVAPPHPRQGCEGLGRKSPPTLLHWASPAPRGSPRPCPGRVRMKLCLLTSASPSRPLGLLGASQAPARPASPAPPPSNLFLSLPGRRDLTLLSVSARPRERGGAFFPAPPESGPAEHGLP